MKSTLFAALLGLSLAGAPFLVGCDTASDPNTKAAHEKTVETNHPDGTTTVDKTKTVTDKDGDTHVEKEHKTNP